jgi:hypothetical protein
LSTSALATSAPRPPTGTWPDITIERCDEPGGGVALGQLIEVHDYVDAKSPVLARMLTKRLAAYSTLDFDVRGVGARRR